MTVDEQRVIFHAGHTRELVHNPARHVGGQVLGPPTHSSDGGCIGDFARIGALVDAGVDAERKCRCNFERGTRRQAATDWHSGGHRAREAARCHVAFAHGCSHASDVATPCGLHCCRVANG